MYVTWSDLIQFGLLVVAIVGLIYEISFRKKITTPIDIGLRAVI